jgi:hypothetical protein
MPKGDIANSLAENVKPSHTGASQHAWRQVSTDVCSDSSPGLSAVPMSVPTKSIRGKLRKSEGAQYGVTDGVRDGVGDCDAERDAVGYS